LTRQLLLQNAHLRKQRGLSALYEQNQLTTETERQAWLERYGMSPEQLEALATRGLKLKNSNKRLGATNWAYFLDRKAQLDKVIYSLIRTKTWSCPGTLFPDSNTGAVLAELARGHKVQKPKLVV